MDFGLKIAKIVALASTAAFAFALAYLCAILARTASDLDEGLKGTRQDLHASLILLNGSLQNLDTVTTKIAGAQDAQAEYWRKEQVQVRRVVDEIHRVAIHADVLVRDIDAGTKPILEHLDQAVQDQNAALLASNRALANSLVALTPAIEQLNRAAGAAATDLGDPAIPATLGHVERTSANVEQTSAHVEAIAADTQGYVHRLTRPARAAWKALETIGSYAAEFAGALVGKTL